MVGFISFIYNIKKGVGWLGKGEYVLVGLLLLFFFFGYWFLFSFPYVFAFVVFCFCLVGFIVNLIEMMLSLVYAHYKRCINIISTIGITKSVLEKKVGAFIFIKENLWLLSLLDSLLVYVLYSNQASKMAIKL